MENNNPNNMSNQDVEKDMQLSSENNLQGNQENVNKSTASEGTLIEPEQDPHQKQAVDYFGNIKSDSNNTQDGGEDGSLPDPEELSLEEEEESFNDPDKISG